MTVIITSIVTLVSASIIVLLISLYVSYHRLKALIEEFKVNLGAFQRELENQDRDNNAAHDGIYREKADDDRIKKYVDSRFDLLLNKVEKDYVRRDQTLLAGKI